MSKESDLPYLRKVIKVQQFQRGQVNLVVAPCHSGKTTAAKEIMEKSNISPYRVLYLIDTRAGRDALISSKAAQSAPYEWMEWVNFYSNAGSIDFGRYITMTYYQFGCFIEQAPQVLKEIDLIICDEMHNLVKYYQMENGRNQKIPPEEILEGIDEGETTYKSALTALEVFSHSDTPNAPLIIALTATPKSVKRIFWQKNIPYRVFDYTDKVRSDKTKKIRHYANLEIVLNELEDRAIVYLPNVKMIKKYFDLINDGKRKVGALWSMHNTEHPLSENQLILRSRILREKRIPSDIDILFINAAYETSINIENEDFNTMIIHTGNEDTQVQARGRLRHDIDTLYLYDSNLEHIAEYFPAKFCNRILYPDDTAAIAEMMKLTNNKGRMLKWPSIEKRLEKAGIRVQHRKKDGNRCCVIHHDCA